MDRTPNRPRCCLVLSKYLGISQFRAILAISAHPQHTHAHSSTSIIDTLSPQDSKNYEEVEASLEASVYLVRLRGQTVSMLGSGRQCCIRIPEDFAPENRDPMPW